MANLREPEPEEVDLVAALVALHATKASFVALSETKASFIALSTSALVRR